MTNTVRKAVFPVAGLGTRLLPATKSIPKEMITIVDRPLIQYAVDEAREAGIEQLIFVTGRGKGSLVDYFDTAFELEAMLNEKGKSLDVLEPSNADFGEVVTVRQQQPLGLGHAVWCARHIVGDEPFAVLLPDELMHGKPNCLAQMVQAYVEVPAHRYRDMERELIVVEQTMLARKEGAAALAVARWSTKRFPKNSDLAVIQAFVANAQGAKDEARSAIAAALAIDPSNRSAVSVKEQIEAK